MYKTIILFFLVIIFIFPMNNIGYGDTIERKDPLLAGVLSWYMPGLGQFYAGNYLKGSIFWITENALLISAILTVADMNFSVDKDIGFQFTIKSKEKITNKQQTIGISLFISYGVFHIYNVLDAIQCVKKNNSLTKVHSRLALDYMNIADNSYYMLNYQF